MSDEEPDRKGVSGRQRNQRCLGNPKVGGKDGILGLPNQKGAK